MTYQVHFCIYIQENGVLFPCQNLDTNVSDNFYHDSLKKWKNVKCTLTDEQNVTIMVGNVIWQNLHKLQVCTTT